MKRKTRRNKAAQEIGELTKNIQILKFAIRQYPDFKI